MQPKWGTNPNGNRAVLPSLWGGARLAWPAEEASYPRKAHPRPPRLDPLPPYAPSPPPFSRFAVLLGEWIRWTDAADEGDSGRLFWLACRTALCRRATRRPRGPYPDFLGRMGGRLLNGRGSLLAKYPGLAPRVSIDRAGPPPRADSFHLDSSPPAVKQLRASFGVTASLASRSASPRTWPRATAFCRSAVILETALALGVQAGRSGGRNRPRAPVASRASRRARG